jgi:hypothetical protein
MAPHGRLGAATGAAGVLTGALGLAFAGAVGVTGAAWRCVTLLDCCPNDLPPPKRLAASACPAINAKPIITNQSHRFILSPFYGLNRKNL